MTLCIRTLTAADVDYAEALAIRAYGRQDTWRFDIELYLDLEPDGCYVATLDDHVVGMGGAINYGPFAWIGLMGVHPDVRGRGIGRAIIDHILSWLREQHCAIAVLDASDAGAPLYSHAGFVNQGKTVLFERETNLPGSDALHPGISALRASDLTKLLAFDRLIFGANRSRVLATLLDQNPNRAFLVRDAVGSIAGHVVAQSGRIGPWLARSRQQAEALLVAALSLQYVVPPVVQAPSQNPEVADLLSCYGFTPRRALRHMYRGPDSPDQNRAHIYGQASFAIG